MSNNQEHDGEANVEQQAGSSNAQDMILFRVGRQVYALPIDCILQILSMVMITPLPSQMLPAKPFTASGDMRQPGSPALLGVINVHGSVVPVADLRRHMGQADCALHLYTPIILTYSQEKLLGLVVDEVVDVVHLAKDQLIPLADILPASAGRRSLIRWMANINERLVPVLSNNALFSELLTPEQSNSLADALSSIPLVPPGGPDAGNVSRPALQTVSTFSEAPAMPVNGSAQDRFGPVSPEEGQPE